MGLLACTKEIDSPVASPDKTSDKDSAVKTYLSVGIKQDSSDEAEAPVVNPLAPETRTYLGASENNKRKVYWSNGDQIAVNGTASEALSGLGENAQETTFEFTGDLDTPYKVVYPASAYKDETHITLPAVQTYKAGGIADGMLPLAGYSADGSSLTLNHLCAMVKVSVKRASGEGADTDNIAAVRFKGKNGEKVSGEFEVSYPVPPASLSDPVTLTAESGTGAELEVRVVKSLATSTSAAVEYYLVVPARTYDNGFDIIVQDANGHVMTKSKASSTELVAGKLYNLTEFAFDPTGTELGIEIDSAEKLIAFATDFNDKKFADQGSSLIATVTDNIVFDATTSAAFIATGGIGTSGESNRFDGLFNGNSSQYTISGLESTVPLFNGTSSSSIIKDLTLDNTCSFTFTNPGSGNFEKGSIVGYHRGTLSNVKVAANVTLEAAEVSTVTALGGLVGRIVVGSVENNCEYSGLISTPATYISSKPDGATDNKGKIIIGGLAGEITNADGSISDSYFKGAISNEAQETEGTDQDNPYLIIGGIVGQLSAGTVSSCNTTSDHETVAGAYSGSEGIIVNKTTVAYCSAVGGIVGENVGGTVSACNNVASVFVTIFKKDNNNSYGRRTSTGGIVGINQSKGTVTGCTNSAAVSHRTNTYFQYLGGVVGRNFGSVSSCTNDGGTLSMMTAGTGSYSARYPHIGGVIAQNSSSNVTNLHNSGNITLSRTENNNDAVYSYIGGVIGLNSKAIDGGAGKNITNSGAILQNYTPSVFSADGFNLGGIVGKTTAAVSNVSNSGNVQYQKATNGGDATANTGGFNIGGVAGKATATITNATNTGEVYFLNNLANVASTGGYNIGGIVGYTEAAVTGCTNGTSNGADGYVHYRQQTGALLKNVRMGGIAGFIPASETVNVKDNTNNGKVYCPFEVNEAGTADNETISYHYIYLGGCVGYASGTALDNCSNHALIQGGNNDTNFNVANTVWVGGIVGYLTGASSINECHHFGNAYNDHFANRDSNAFDGPLCGGIAGIVYGESGKVISVTGCTVESDAIVQGRRGTVGGILGSGIYASISSCTVPVNITNQSGYNYGGIAGIVTNCTVSNCTYSGSTISSSQIKMGGGIVGKVISGTTVIDGCSSQVTSITKNGAAITAGSIVGTSVAGTTIQNCHYKTTYAIAGTGSFTDGGGNAADL